MLDLRNREIAAGKRFLGPKRLTPEILYWTMRITATDMTLRNFGGAIGPQPVENPTGFDFDTGFGFVNAPLALQAVTGF
jgi:hypothetical protein